MAGFDICNVRLFVFSFNQLTPDSITMQINPVYRIPTLAINTVRAPDESSNSNTESCQPEH